MMMILSPPPPALDVLTLAAVAQHWRQHYLGAKLKALHALSDSALVLSWWHKPAQGPPVTSPWLIELNRGLPFVCPCPQGLLTPTIAQRFSATEERRGKRYFPALETLQRQLVGAVLQGVEAIEGEAVLKLTFATKDLLGFSQQRLLWLELMPKFSNLALTEAAPWRVLALWRSLPAHSNRHRTLEPGGLYALPPTPPNKPLLRHALAQGLAATPQALACWQAFRRFWQQAAWGLPMGVLKGWQTAGLTPYQAQEAFQALVKAPPDAANPWVWALQEDATPLLLPQGLMAQWLPQHRGTPFVEEWLGSLYAPYALGAQWQQARQRLAKPLLAEQQKVAQQVATLQSTLAQQAASGAQGLEAATILQEQANTLMLAHSMGLLEGTHPTSHTLYLTHPLTQAPWPVEDLRLELSWPQQAQRWYKQAQKQRQTQRYQQEQLPLWQAKANYLNQLQLHWQQGTTLEELQALEADWQEAGLLPSASSFKKVAQRKGKPLKAKAGGGGLPPPPPLIKLPAVEGQGTVWVGKSAKANAYLVQRLGKPNDWWLHVGDGLQGSHVLIQGADTPLNPAVLEQAAQCAAYYSQGQQAQKVLVVYTQLKHVRAIPKSWPGHVSYKQEQGVWVVPQAALAP